MDDVPRGLRGLHLEDEYRSDSHNLANDLFVPCLAVAIAYDRAVGYFTSSGLVAAARGLDAFAGRAGKMRLVASPHLAEHDVDAIERGIRARDDVVEQVLIRELLVDLSDGDRLRLAYLSWLIAEDRLEISIAVPRLTRRGIFHEKIGVFTDAHGNRVAISGSPNETSGGLVENFETVDVFRSWDGTASRVQRKIDNFGRLWTNNTAGLDVFPFSEAARGQLLRAAPPHLAQHPRARPRRAAERASGVAGPDDFHLRWYQRRALDEWNANDRVGILEMATGTGKTKTSLAGAAELQHDLGRLAIVVLAPYIHLVDQWADEIRRWGILPVKCFEARTNWLPDAASALDLFRASASTAMALIATHTTARTELFQALVNRIRGEQLLVIADEAHHLGSGAGLDALPSHARYRLALSATPDRWGDPRGTTGLHRYFDRIVFAFGISDAIKAGALCSYMYYPLLVPLTSDELGQYRPVTESIVSELRRPVGERNVKLLRQLMDQRSAIIDTAEGKLEALRIQVEADRPFLSLIYCSNRMQLSAVMDLLWERRIPSRQFTGEESRTERSEILDGLANGNIPAVVAMKCLDEGVDVPPARSADILASSGNPREWVQRRGRILRLYPGKDRALIRDYVVFPDGDSEGERELLRHEIRRVVAFAGAAENHARALSGVWELMAKYGLLDEMGGPSGHTGDSGGIP
jgi:superfamily II DNA or RNA helicase